MYVSKNVQIVYQNTLNIVENIYIQQHSNIKVIFLPDLCWSSFFFSSIKTTEMEIIPIIYRRCWHIWHTVADLALANVQCSHDQWAESSMVLEPLDLAVDAVPLVLLVRLLLLPAPKRDPVVRLVPPWASTSDRPFSRARTRFSK